MKKIIAKILLEIKYRLIKWGYYSKPDFVIIGAQKSGTTGLFLLLNNHSLLKGAKKRKFTFLIMMNGMAPISIMNTGPFFLYHFDCQKEARLSKLLQCIFIIP